MNPLMHIALLIIFSVFLSSESFAGGLNEQCVYGYQGEQSYTISYQESSVEGVQKNYNNVCNPDTGSKVCSSPTVTTAERWFGTEYTMTYQFVDPSSCARQPLDDSKDSGCYDHEMELNSAGVRTCHGEDTKECSTPGGATYTLAEGKNCQSYCVGDNPNTEFIAETVSHCSVAEGEQLSETGSDDDQQCPAGTILDITTGACETSCGGFPCDDTTDPDSGSGSDGSDSGGDDTGGGDSGGDTGGDDTGGDIPDETGDGDSVSTCDSSSSCLDQARANESCDYDRDMEYYTYISGGAYFYECQYCNGPQSSTYSECNLCEYGYNGDTDACYPVTCPFGDCTNPNENNQTPDRPSDDDNTQVVAAIRDLQAEIAHGVDVNQLPELINIVQSFKTDNANNLQSVSDSVTSNADGNTQQIIDALGDLKTAVEEIPGGGGSGDLPGTEEPSDCDPASEDCSSIEDLLEEIIEIQEDIACSVSNGSDDPDSSCPPPSESEDFDHQQAAEGLYASWKSTQWGGALDTISSAATGVSSTCNLDFSLYVPYAETEISAPICDYINPISNTLRIFAIAIWGFLGVRHIFSA